MFVIHNLQLAQYRLPYLDMLGHARPTYRLFAGRFCACVLNLVPV